MSIPGFCNRDEDQYYTSHGSEGDCACDDGAAFDFDFDLDGDDEDAFFFCLNSSYVMGD